MDIDTDIDIDMLAQMFLYILKYCIIYLVTGYATPEWFKSYPTLI